MELEQDTKIRITKSEEEKSKRPPIPTINNNIAIIYDMFPTNFEDFEDMKEYLSILKLLNFNVVWVNPIQNATPNGQSKGDMVTGVKSHVAFSMYAMHDDNFIDPRFSLAEHDQYGCVKLTEHLVNNITKDEIYNIEKSQYQFKELMVKRQLYIKNIESDLTELKNEIITQEKNKKLAIQNDPQLKEWQKLFKSEETDKEALASQVNKRKEELAKKFDTTINKLKVQIEHFDQGLLEIDSQISDIINFQRKIVADADKRALQKFTHTAVELGILPMFDLVLNHVGLNSNIYNNHKKDGWFDEEDKTYHDATAFIYGTLVNDEYKHRIQEKCKEEIKKINKEFDEKIDKLDKSSTDYEAQKTLLNQAREENILITQKTYDQKIVEQKQLIESKIPEIIEYWKKYIDNYMGKNGFGFCAVRIDCARKVPREIREILYEHIRKHNPNAVILEEALYDKVSAEQLSITMGNAGGTHSTGSVYYGVRNEYGDLDTSTSGQSFDPNEEDKWKQNTVNVGVINFTGNHDEHSCAMEICIEMAKERIKKNSSFNDLLHKYDGKLTGNSLKLYQMKILYPYIEQIKRELNNSDPHTTQEFKQALLDKWATCMFSGSGGYYMLTGDEFASMFTPSVFLRNDRLQMYPQETLAIFLSIEQKLLAKQDLDQDEKIVYDVLKLMAEAMIKDEGLQKDYTSLGPEAKQQYLAPFITQLFTEINSYYKAEEFVNLLKKKMPEKQVHKLIQDTVPLPRNCDNGWSSPNINIINLQHLAQMNSILQNMPTPEKGFWCELFNKNQDPPLFIAVRKNGPGLDSRTDIVVINLDPSKTATIGEEVLHDLGCWMQKRCQHMKGYNHDQAYLCITNANGQSEQYPHLHLGPGLNTKPSLSQNLIIHHPGPETPIIISNRKKMNKSSSTLQELQDNEPVHTKHGENKIKIGELYQSHKTNSKFSEIQEVVSHPLFLLVEKGYLHPKHLTDNSLSELQCTNLFDLKDLILEGTLNIKLALELTEDQTARILKKPEESTIREIEKEVRSQRKEEVISTESPSLPQNSTGTPSNPTTQNPFKSNFQ